MLLSRLFRPRHTDARTRIRSQGGLRASLAAFVGLSLCLSMASASAAPGDPDLSFGPGLVVTPPFDESNSLANAAAMDGNLLYVGGGCQATGLSVTEVFCIVRYLPDGRVDRTFGGSGRVLVLTGDNMNHDSRIRAIAVQPDRKLVVAGECRSTAQPVNAFCLARLRPDGSLDNAFGTGGIVITTFGGSVSGTELTAMALQSDGNVVVGGTCKVPLSTFCLARYRATDGALDTSFATGGKLVVGAVGSASDAYLNALLVQSDGRVVAVGRCVTGVVTQFCATRHTSTGTVDATWGSNGALLLSISRSDDRAASVAQQSDGKLLLTGTCVVSGAYKNFCLTRRLLADGAPDAGFGDNGNLTLTRIENEDFAFNVLLQLDGKIVVAGNCMDSGNGAFCATRLQTSGERDASYNGARGYNRTNLGDIIPGAAVLQLDGKLLQVGSCKQSGRWQFCFVRYDASGALDLSLSGGGSGVVKAAFSALGDAEARALVVQPDGKTILAGYCTNDGAADFCLTRHLRSGVLDPSFGNGGRVVTSISTGDDFATAAVIQPDRKIVLAGTCFGPSNTFDFCVARYLPGGTLDASFGQGGKVITAIGGAADGVTSVLLQPDGKIVVAGYCQDANTTLYNFCAARYRGDGALDTGFGTGGKLITDVSGNQDFANSALLQPDGKIVLGGNCFVNTDYDFCLVRYLSDGTVDFLFGPGGSVTRTVGLALDAATAIALQPDGKIVMAGYCTDLPGSSRTLFCAARFLENGAIDGSFGNGGLLVDGLDGKDTAYAVALQPDGKILVGGSCGNDTTACVARYHPTGWRDKTFGAARDGKQLDSVSRSVSMRALVALADGTIVQGGTCTEGDKKVFCLLRREGGPLSYLNCSLDIDGDGEVTPTIDTLILNRVMRGMTGPEVIGQIVFPSHALRTTWGDDSPRDIRRYLRTQCSLPIPR
jgi:uncharacterized delta-60 repeat protein